MTPLAERFGHPSRKPRQIALRSVEIVGLHIDCCANLMLLALVWMVCVKKPNSFGGGVGSVYFAVSTVS